MTIVVPIIHQKQNFVIMSVNDLSLSDDDAPAKLFQTQINHDSISKCSILKCVSDESNLASNMNKDRLPTPINLDVKASV
jgi:hypothetical protein